MGSSDSTGTDRASAEPPAPCPRLLRGGGEHREDVRLQEMAGHQVGKEGVTLHSHFDAEARLPTHLSYLLHIPEQRCFPPVL